MPSPLDLALALASAGFSVFPVSPADKSPCIPKDEGGKGFRGATRDERVIRAIWRKYPDARPAIWPAACAFPLVVLDIDRKNGAPGFESLAALQAADPEMLPPTFTVKTPSGGEHWIYRLPESAEAPGNRDLAPGINVRSSSGYIVWWHDGLPPDAFEITEAPASLIAHLGKAQERAENADTCLCDWDLPENVARARAFLEHTEPAIEGVPNAKGETGGKWTLLTAEVVRDFGVSEEICLELMLASGWNDRCLPPWEPDDLARQIGNGYRYAKRPAGSKTVDPASLERMKEMAREAAADRPQSTGMFGGSRSLNAAAVEPKQVHFSWRPYILKGAISIIGGRGGGGKGLVAAHAAAAVSTGGKWPCGLPASQGRVLWGETEDPLDRVLVPRLQAAGADLSRIEFINPAVFTMGGLVDLIREHCPALIVMSPLVSFLRGLLSDIRDEMAVRGALEQLQAALEDTGAAVLGIGHLNKKPDLAAIERLLGSVAFANFVRSVLMVAPEEDAEGVFRLVHAKHNNSIKGADWCYRPLKDGPYEQSVRLEWSRPDSNIDADSMFDKRKPDGNSSASAWLVWYLQLSGEADRKTLMKEAKEAGYTEAAIKQAQHRNRRITVRHTRAFPPATLWSLAGYERPGEAA